MLPIKSKKKILLKDNSKTKYHREDYSINDFKKRLLIHKANIKRTFKLILNELKYRAKVHDHSKVESLPLQYEVTKRYIGRSEQYHSIKDNEAFAYHVKNERHHLQSFVPDDVNLFDVIELIVDCITCSVERQKDFRAIDITDKTLMLAFNNTCKQLLELLENKDSKK